MSVRIYLDANIFIEAFEKRGENSEHARAILTLVRDREATGVISELIVAELLVRPLADHDHEMIELYSSLLAEPGGYETCPVDWIILREAARQRAQRKAIKMPDAIHLATATIKNCAAFVSGDERLRSNELKCVALNSTVTHEIRSLA